jgi:dephospho-CoA kinase
MMLEGKPLRTVSSVRVGLTGGVGAGKSTAARALADLGAVVVDADALAREVVATGTPGLAAVVAEFGPDILAPDGSLDRSRLGQLVFSDPARRKALEAIVHPLVRRRAGELEAAAPAGALVVHDIPLLAETGQDGSFDAVLVVDVPVEVQVERLVRARGWSADEAAARIAAQAAREDRLAVATHVLDNSGTPEDLRRHVAEVFEELTGSGGDRSADPAS